MRSRQPTTDQCRHRGLGHAYSDAHDDGRGEQTDRANGGAATGGAQCRQQETNDDGCYDADPRHKPRADQRRSGEYDDWRAAQGADFRAREIELSCGAPE